MAKNKAKIRVLVATGIYPPDIGGPAVYSKLLYDELPAYGIEVDVLSFGSVRMFPPGIRHLFYFFFLLWKGFRADILYAQDPFSVGFPTLLASNVLKKTFLLKIVGDYAWEQGTVRFGVKESLEEFSKKSGGYGLFVKVLKFVQKRAAFGADLVIVPSKFLKKIVSNWGIPQQQIKVIYNSFDVPKNIAKKEVLREMMDLRGKVVVSIGRLVPWKGFDALVDVMGNVVKKVQDAKLLIIGSGVEEKKLEWKIEKKKASPYVILVGSLDHDTLLRYVQASDLFVLNTFYEGLSHQILECLALGVPVVTTDVGGNPEVIEDGKNGVLVPFNDKKALEANIVELLSNEAKRNRFSRKGKETAAGFAKGKMLKETVSLLQHI